MTEKEKLLKALQTLAFWSMCFDYKNYSSANPLYGGREGCNEAKWLLEEFIEKNAKEE